MDAYWFERTAEDVPEGDSWLGAREQAQLATLKFPKRRLDWRLGRWTAKCALAAYLNLDPDLLAEIEICVAKTGAPKAFIHSHPAAVTISISHRSGVALCALASHSVRLGCDLELIEPRTDSFIADYFTEEEQHLVELARAADRACLVTLLWSAKESALKALQEGLRRDTRSVAVQFKEINSCDGWNSFKVLSPEGDSFHGWWQDAGAAVRTIVADQFLASPVHLQPVRHGDRSSDYQIPHHENQLPFNE